MKNFLIILVCFLPVQILVAQQTEKSFSITQKQNKAEWKTINQKIQIALLNGEIWAYHDDVRSPYDPDELKEMTFYKEPVTVYPNPNNPKEFYDSTITESYADFIQGYKVRYSGAGNKRHIEAISPYFIKYEGPNDEMKPVSMQLFWLKWEELRKILDPEEIQFMKEHLN